MVAVTMVPFPVFACISLHFNALILVYAANCSSSQSAQARKMFGYLLLANFHIVLVHNNKFTCRKPELGYTTMWFPIADFTRFVHSVAQNLTPEIWS
jgi:hypothetical protein